MSGTGSEKADAMAEHPRSEEAGRFVSLPAEEQHRLLLECIPDHALFFLDLQGRVAGWNVGAERMLGYSEAEILGQPFSLLLTAENQGGGPPEWGWQRVAEHGRTSFDRWMVRKDGSQLWASGVITALRDSGEAGVQGFALVVRDRTEQRRAEENAQVTERRFRALVENAWDGVTLLGADCTMLETTPITFRGLGYTAEEYIGHNGMELLHPDDLPLVQNALGQLLSQPGSKLTIQYRLRHKDGSWRWVEAFVSNLLHEPSVRAIVVNHRDITELRHRAEQLAEADRRKDEFLAMLAHELRNPLSPILTSVQMLRLLAPDEARLQSVNDIIDRQTRHLARLVDDLLDVSRVTRGKINIQRKILEARTAVNRAVELARPMIQSRRHQLIVQMPSGSLWLEGDLTRLAQVLGNLLSNAAKYSDEGGKITISVELDSEKREMVFRVRDEGMGIPADMLSSIFELFIQVNRGIDRSQGGLGIGLSLVRSLVEMHGGTVQAFSQGAGKGSEFVVRLPALLKGPATEFQTINQGVPGSHCRRVLVVDDNLDAATSLALFLRQKGHETMTADNGPTALSAARDFRPEVVLLDIGLPKMDGYEVARRLRQEHSREKIVLVAVTGYGQEEDRRRTREAGFDHHLVKPAEPDHVVKLLADLGENNT